MDLEVEEKMMITTTTTTTVYRDYGCESKREEHNNNNNNNTRILEVVMDVNWLELPEDLTSYITSKLISITDLARFGAVCVKWRAIFRKDYDYTTSLLPPQLPLLMIPTPPPPPSHKNKNKLYKNKNKNKNNKNDTSISCSFYRVTDGKIFNRLQLEMPRDRYVRGSGHGWLITVDQDEICCSVQLMNPFLYPNTSTKEIKLPPLSAHPINKDEFEFHYIHLRKAIISADPVSYPKDFIVMMIFGDYATLAFWKPGDKAWTPIKDNDKGLFRDVIHYQGKFYALQRKGAIVVCNMATCTTSVFARAPVTNFYSRKKYLVMSEWKLLQVHRGFDQKGNSIGFKVFMLQRRESSDWVEVKDLGNHALFLGDNASMSISVSDFPGCKPNCIYYTDDFMELYFDDPERGPRDLGVFNLNSGSFEKHYSLDVSIQPLVAPIWIEPTLPRIISRPRFKN